MPKNALYIWQLRTKERSFFSIKSIGKGVISLKLIKTKLFYKVSIVSCKGKDSSSLKTYQYLKSPMFQCSLSVKVMSGTVGLHYIMIHKKLRQNWDGDAGCGLTNSSRPGTPDIL